MENKRTMFSKYHHGKIFLIIPFLLLCSVSNFFHSVNKIIKLVLFIVNSPAVIKGCNTYHVLQPSMFHRPLMLKGKMPLHLQSNKFVSGPSQDQG